MAFRSVDIALVGGRRVQKRREARLSVTKKRRGLLPSFLHIVLHKFFGIFFQDIIDLID